MDDCAVADHARVGGRQIVALVAGHAGAGGAVRGARGDLVGERQSVRSNAKYEAFYV